MPKQLNRIETHSHYMPSAIYGAAGPYGPELIVNPETQKMRFRAGSYMSEPAKFRRDKRNEGDDPSARIADMDSLDIDVMGIAASPMIYCYGASVEDGVRYCRTYNDAMAEFCGKAPDRLFFIPTLPMQDVKQAISEAERARGLGGRGVNIGTDCVAGMELDDPRLLEFFEYCEARDTTIWLHPAPPGTDDPTYDPASNDKDKYLFAWLIGYPHREMIAFATLVYSGVLDRFPRLRVCLTHGGGFVPYQLERLGYGWHKKLTPAMVNERPVSDYLKNFYFDNVVHDPRARRLLLDVMGPDNVFVGSNYGGWDWVSGFDYAETMTDDEPESVTSPRQACTLRVTPNSEEGPWFGEFGHAPNPSQASRLRPYPDGRPDAGRAYAEDALARAGRGRWGAARA